MEGLKELIEKQIEEAAGHQAVMMDMHARGMMEGWGKAIDGFCACLLQIIQNQQAMIDAVQKEAFDAAIEKEEGKAKLVRFKRGEEPKW